MKEDVKKGEKQWAVGGKVLFLMITHFKMSFLFQVKKSRQMILLLYPNRKTNPNFLKSYMSYNTKYLLSLIQIIILTCAKQVDIWKNVILQEF